MQDHLVQEWLDELTTLDDLTVTSHGDRLVCTAWFVDGHREVVLWYDHEGRR